MMSGISLATLSLLLATRVQAGSSVRPDLGLPGAARNGIGHLLREPHVGVPGRCGAGRRRGGLGADQRGPAIGAALGLAVLVTVFGVATRHAQIGARVGAAKVARADGVLVHGLHDVFGVGASSPCRAR